MRRSGDEKRLETLTLWGGQGSLALVGWTGTLRTDWLEWGWNACRAVSITNSGYVKSSADIDRSLERLHGLGWAGLGWDYLHYMHLHPHTHTPTTHNTNTHPYATRDTRALSFLPRHLSVRFSPDLITFSDPRDKGTDPVGSKQGLSQRTQSPQPCPAPPAEAA